MWALITIILLVSTGWLFFAWYPTPVSGPLFEYTDVEIHSPTALCPGEALNYDLTLHYDGQGVFVIDISVWRVTPPATVVYSESRRVVMTGPQEMLLPQRWVVPDRVFNPKTGLTEPFTPGLYERRHAVTTASRATAPAIIAVPFTVRGDCGE
jgi:hypothetical protein